MGKKNWKRVVALAFCFILLSGSGSAQAAEKITRSTEKYEVVLQDASRVFIGNKKPVDWNVGDKYFLTYTVSEVESNGTIQSGLVVTSDREQWYPHTKGGMQYDQKSLLCQEGYTYFLRFEVTEDGMRYVAARAKVEGEEDEYIRFPYVVDDLTTKGLWFGAWFGEGGTVTARLTHVRCYDENGNDLGVYGNKSQGVFAFRESEVQPLEGIDHSYSFSLENAACVAFGSAKPSMDDTIFLEYKISNVKAENINQSGVIMTSDPTAKYPHSPEVGYLNYAPHMNQDSACRLVEEGAHYFVRFDRKEDSYEVMVKRTLNGKEDFFSFEHFSGTASGDWPYAVLWIGENCSLTADFTDVKCYDSKGNNLAITTNQGVKVMHYGDLEDYSACEAVYYCKENNTFISLDDECNASKRVDGEATSDVGTYSIRETTLSLKIGEEEEKFDYIYTALTDKDNNRYVRLKESDVTFHSRFMGGDVIETVKVTAADGFKLKRPDEPAEEGLTFAYWKTGADEEYDFDTVVTHTMDLYAEWEGKDVRATISVPKKSITAMMVIIPAACVLLAAATITGVIFISREKKDGKAQEKEKNK